MNEPQTIDQLRERYEKLNAVKTQATTDLAVAEEALRIAKEAALKEYGTDDIGKLEAMLAEWQEENETKRREYQESLERIEADLERVRQEHEEHP